MHHIVFYICHPSYQVSKKTLLKDMCDYLAKKRLFWDILNIPNIELSTLFKNNLPQRTRCINPQGFAQPKLEIAHRK